MVEYLNDLNYGAHKLTEINGKHQEALMDITVVKLPKGAVETRCETLKETAFLLLNGKLVIQWEDKRETVSRGSFFDEGAWCLHIPKDVKVQIEALADSEILIQGTENSRNFKSKLYSPQECTSEIFGEGVWNDTARRVVRTIFDYNNAPYSNMVIGETINYPGKWSSYPPHHHPQPEVYFYRFNKPQGFGVCLLGEAAYKIKNNSFAVIAGEPVHPQVAAPGYVMYICWMIRHLENNPWTSRINDPAHVWLFDKNVKIWPDK
jgi:5-deoxy-glucuronate isomerase